ncbi:MAG: hypothetical protein BWY77_01972 [bacterium ADurb.Bin431]|nr:MAG: hypothetical protein BWY77_01972 [bacterium ADurb.Bin431]
MLHRKHRLLSALRRKGEFSAQLGLAVAEAPLAELEILQPAAIPGLEADRPPDSAGDQTRTPVPAVVKTRLAGVHVDLDVGLVVVGIGGQPERGRLPFGQVFGKDGTEANLELVGTPDKPGFDVRSPDTKHIIGVQYLVAVEEHTGVGIEPFADQLDFLPREQLLRRYEPGAVEPIPFADPLHEFFVDAVMGIGNEVMAHEIGVDAPRHFRIQPGGLVAVRTERPVGMKLVGQDLCQSGGGHQRNHQECPSQCFHISFHHPLRSRARLRLISSLRWATQAAERRGSGGVLRT